HLPALTVLDRSATNWSPILKNGRATDTIRRIFRGRGQLGDHFLVAYYGRDRGGRSVHKPLGTVVTRDRFAEVKGPRMRMLTARAYLVAQGFRPDYRLTGDHKTDVHLIGNAVPPPMTRHVVNTLNRNLAA